MLGLDIIWNVNVLTAGSKPSRFASHRIATFSGRVLAVFIVPAFSASLMSVLLLKTPNAPFDDLEQFARDGTYKLTVAKNEKHLLLKVSCLPGLPLHLTPKKKTFTSHMIYYHEMKKETPGHVRRHYSTHRIIASSILFSKDISAHRSQIKNLVTTLLN